MPKSTAAIALAGALAAALAAAPLAAQGVDAASIQRGGWLEVGQLDGGMVLSLSQDKYLDGTVLTFGIKVDYASGELRTTIEVVELDCAAHRSRRVSAASTKRTGEMEARNEAGEFAPYTAESVMAALAEPLCAQVPGAGAG